MEVLTSVVGNPYLKRYKSLVEQYSRYSPHVFTARHALVREYAFALPTAKVVQAIRAFDRPVVEWGAGSGYWAAMLAVAGVDVTAFDCAPVGYPDTTNEYNFTASYYPVRHANDSAKLADYPQHILLLVWPPMSSMAYDALQSFTGRYVVYVGESRTGCTADDAFFDELKHHWTLVQQLEIPQWPSIHDHAFFYERKGS